MCSYTDEGFDSLDWGESLAKAGGIVPKLDNLNSLCNIGLKFSHFCIAFLCQLLRLCRGLIAHLTDRLIWTIWYTSLPFFFILRIFTFCYAKFIDMWSLSSSGELVIIKVQVYAV